MSSLASTAWPATSSAGPSPHDWLALSACAPADVAFTHPAALDPLEVPWLGLTVRYPAFQQTAAGLQFRPEAALRLACMVVLARLPMEANDELLRTVTAMHEYYSAPPTPPEPERFEPARRASSLPETVSPDFVFDDEP